MARVEIGETVKQALDALPASRGLPVPLDKQMLVVGNGADVEVRLRGESDATGVILYSAATGAGTLSNPLTADNEGRIEGYVENGKSYDLVVTLDGETYTQEFEAKRADVGAVYWQTRAAMLDPAAIWRPLLPAVSLAGYEEQHTLVQPNTPTTQTPRFDHTLTQPVYVIDAHRVILNGGLIAGAGTTGPESRTDVRRPPGLGSLTCWPTGTRIQATGVLGGGSKVFAVDPSLVEYEDPEAKFYERLALLETLSVKTSSVYMPRGESNGNYMERIDQTRRHFDSGVAFNAWAGTQGVLSSTTRQATQFNFPSPLVSPIGTDLELDLCLRRQAGNSGDVIVEIQTDDGSGNPSGTVIGTGTIAAASLPAIDGAAAWCRVDIELSAEIPDRAALGGGHKRWVVARGSTGTTAAAWLPAKGAQVGDAAASAAWVYAGKTSTDSGSTWAVTAATTGCYSLRINDDDQPDILIVGVTNFDGSWTILNDTFTPISWNVYQENSDSDRVRYTYEPFWPWSFRDGMHFGSNKVLDETGTNPDASSTIRYVELPSDW